MDPRQPNDLQSGLSYTEQVQRQFVNTACRHTQIFVSRVALHLCGDIRVLRISKTAMIASPWFPSGVLYRIKLTNSRDGAYYLQA